MTQNSSQLKQMANAIRALSMDAVQAANSGHPGAPMGMADMAAVLFSKFMTVDPKNPTWMNRDRFVLSNGHASMLLYAVNHLLGYKGMDLEQIKNFRQLGFHTAGHPEVDQDLGIETTTGPLGQGIANAVGMALAEQILAAKYGQDVMTHYTYAFTGDGCLMEGISHEALSLAGHLKLRKLIVLWDDNKITIDGSTDLSTSEDMPKRLAAYGWNVLHADGHDFEEIETAIRQAQDSDKPTFICCKTTIGYGSPNKAGTSGVHGSPLGDAEIQLVREQIGWPHGPFEVPQEVYDLWQEVADRGAKAHQDWSEKFENHGSAQELSDRFAGKLPQEIQDAFDAAMAEFLDAKPAMATRKTSQKVLEKITAVAPSLIGGSADLTGSNNTNTPSTAPISTENFDGSYVYYGIREHGMAAVMNGLALHGGIIPYGGTFLTFADYSRPAIRLAALMGIRVIHVMTHDSIGLGEDGPTHQPIEHLSSLRAIPNLNVYRPMDGIETAECWKLAVESAATPSVLALSRQNLPTLRTDKTENKSAKGVYILKGSEAAKIKLFASGSEVQVSIETQSLLADKGIDTAVYSCPCLDLYKEDDAFESELNVVIEAAEPSSWYKHLNKTDLVIGMTSFGASAPAKDLYTHFGFDPADICAKILEKVS